MAFNKKMATSLVVGLAALASSAAFAFGPQGLYILGGVGYGGVSNNELDTAGSFSTFNTSGDFAWRFGVGSWMNDNFGVEFNYQQVADVDSTIGLDVTDNGGSQTKLDSESQYMFDVSGIFRVPVMDNISWFGKLGMGYANQERKFTVTGGDSAGSFNDDKSGVGAVFGTGFQWDYNDMFGIRVEGNTLQSSDVDYYVATANVVINLGALRGMRG